MLDGFRTRRMGAQQIDPALRIVFRQLRNQPYLHSHLLEKALH
jgi:hypothetical protein